MILMILQIWIACALLVFFFNTYLQLVLADNWPPSDWRRVSWDAVLILLTISLFAWPIVLAMLWMDKNTYRRTGARQAKQK